MKLSLKTYKFFTSQSVECTFFQNISNSDLDSFIKAILVCYVENHPNSKLHPTVAAVWQCLHHNADWFRKCVTDAYPNEPNYSSKKLSVKDFIENNN